MFILKTGHQPGVYVPQGTFSSFCFFAVSSALAAIKMAARFFLHGDHLEKVVLSGTPLLRHGQYHRTSSRHNMYVMTGKCD